MTRGQRAEDDLGAGSFPGGARSWDPDPHEHNTRSQKSGVFSVFAAGRIMRQAQICSQC